MTEILPFVVAGLVSGVIFGLSGTSLVVTYRTSGIFNFGQGAMATVGAYAFYFLWLRLGLNWLAALLVVVLVIGPLMGLLMERISRRLAHHRAEWKIVGTIGLVLLVQGIGSLWYGPDTTPVKQFLPGADSFVSVAGVAIAYSQMITIAIALVIIFALQAMFRFTRLGVTMRAVVEDPDLADLQGTNPVQVRRTAWVLGSSIVALSGTLLLPLIGLSSLLITFLVVDTFAAAAIGRFRSIPLTFLGGLLVGVGGALLTKFELTNKFLVGASNALPFVLLLLVMLVIPKRRLVSPSGHEARPPLLWHGPPKLRIAAYVVTFALLATVPSWTPSYLLTPYWSDALILAIVVLALGLLVRSAGIVSLCTATFAAIGAVAFSGFYVDLELPWLVAVLLSGLVAVPVGALVALPAIRLSGLFLALATLGFGLLVQQLLYPRSFMFTELAVGRQTPRPDWAQGDGQYYYLVLAFLAVMVGLIALVNRARLGRILRGIGDSSKALSVLGLNVQSARILVFSISAFMAAIAGTLHGALLGSVSSSDQFYTPFHSIVVLAILALAPFRVPWYAIFAGVTAVIPGYIEGDSVPYVMNIVFGLSAIAVAAQGGPPPMPVKLRRILEARFGKAQDKSVTGTAEVESAEIEQIAKSRVAARQSSDRSGLSVENLTIRFGGLVAVNDVTLRAPGGRITGLIGPNGAGKTTTFDACSGLNRPTNGVIRFNGTDVSRIPPDGRARLGVGRTFQVMELCDSLTVAENVALGWEASRAGRSWRTQFVALRGEEQTRIKAAAQAMELCGITDLAGLQTGSLSTGQRRLVDLARALAGPFDVLLLDEPSSGLGDEESARFADVVRRVVAERGCGVLLIEHDMPLVMNMCDYIYVLDFGRLIFEGEPSAVASSELVQTAYLGETFTQEGTNDVEDLADTMSGGAGGRDE